MRSTKRLNLYFSLLLFLNHTLPKYSTRNLFKTGKKSTRESREGWPLLTVETEVHGDSKSINVRGPSLVGFVGLSCQCQYKRFLVSLGCSSQPSTKYFFPRCTLFQCLCPHRPASWAGSRAGSPVSYFCVSGIDYFNMTVCKKDSQLACNNVWCHCLCQDMTMYRQS
jgi:hypothetical protein